MYRSRLSFILFFSTITLAMPEEVPKGGCTCSVMQKDYQNPILEHALHYNVDCNPNGEEICQKLCIALAETAKEQAPVMICEKLNQTVTDFKLELNSKICNETEWKPSDLENTESLCCEEGKPIMCS